NLTSLTWLALDFTPLTAIPAEIGNLTSLTWLDLDGNQLTAIPAEIGNLTSLTSLSLGDNQLTAIPAEIGNLTSLTTLYLDINQLTALPDLTSLTHLTSFFIANNQFTFEDIEPIIGVGGYFRYSPQDSMGSEIDTSVSIGLSLALSVAVGGTANLYQWMKDGTDIIGGTSDTLHIASVSFADSGSYVLSVTNTIVVGLTLFSRPIRLNMSNSTLDIGDVAVVPKAYDLHQNYPNPFNPRSSIRFDLPEATHLELVVYDMMGREVVRLAGGKMPAGSHKVIWDGQDRAGRGVPSGIYIARIVTPGFTKSIKMVLLK
ncbi:MAG: leucine-rich repeat domain-containing protein, partial [Candidatus Marinimicrobia bacterium]|nr:leucine-rich repeat domain-containing protein [Candidatus Neomarinimicrobiota bacterium]